MLIGSPWLWAASPAAQVVHADDSVLVLPLTEPLQQPTVLGGTAAVLWEILAHAGEGGLGVDDLLSAIGADSTAPPSDLAAVASDISAFLDDLFARGLLTRMLGELSSTPAT